MGGLAAAAGLGQTLGSAIGGWLFGVDGQWAFGWMIGPLLPMLLFLLLRPGWLAGSDHVPLGNPLSE